MGVDPSAADPAPNAEASGEVFADESETMDGRLVERGDSEASFEAPVIGGELLAPPPAPAPDGNAPRPMDRGNAGGRSLAPRGQRPATERVVTAPPPRPARTARPRGSGGSGASGGVDTTTVTRNSGHRSPAVRPGPATRMPVPAEPPRALPEPEPRSHGAADGAESRPRQAPALDDAPIADETARPGLATSWGEARISPARRVFFERASDAPFAIATFHYDDWEGVERMLSHGVARGATIGPVALGPAGGITVAIVDERGSPLPAYSLGGRIVVAGAAGTRYSIRIVNGTSGNIEIVASVDGLDVLDGLEASTSKRGYIVAAWQSLTIEGYRTTIDAVAAFRFGAVGESYAALTTGSARNVGVIGVALFAQRLPDGWHDREIDLRENATPYPADHFARPGS